MKKILLVFTLLLLVGCQSKMYAIYVDDEPVLVMSQEEALIRLRDAAKLVQTPTGQDPKDLDFKKTVTIKTIRKYDETIFYEDESRAFDYLMTHVPVEVTHIIKKGDNYHDIAMSYLISIRDLIDANPGIDEKAIKVGFELVIPNQTAPLLEVK